MLRLFVLFITFPPKKSVRGDARIGAVFVYYILSSSQLGWEGGRGSRRESIGSQWTIGVNSVGWYKKTSCRLNSKTLDPQYRHSGTTERHRSLDPPH